MIQANLKIRREECPGRNGSVKVGQSTQETSRRDRRQPNKTKEVNTHNQPLHQTKHHPSGLYDVSPVFVVFHS